MRRLSALDRIVHNFQHNWETSPQFRAMWSGGLGLTIVVMLCACLGVAFTFAGSVAANMSGTDTTTFGPPAVGTAHGCGADCNLTFPTPTVPSWAPPLIPQGQPIPPSLTPAPTPTALPTPTPVPTTAGGNGGGGNGGNGGGCGNCTVTVTGATLKGGTIGQVQIQTGVPNALVNIFINWPDGSSSPTNTGNTNGSGAGTITTTPVPVGCSGQVKLWVKTDISGTTTAYFPCTP